MPRLARVAARLRDARVGMEAAALAYSFLFSIVPLLLVVAALTAALHLPGPGRLLQGPSADVLPRAVRAVLRESLARLSGRTSTAALSLGLVGYLWGMSGAVRKALSAVRCAYGEAPGGQRPWWRAYAESLVLSATLGLVLVAGVALTLVGRGVLAWLAGRLGLRLPAALVDALRWLGVGAVFASVAALLYRLAPGRPHPVGAGVAAALVLWLGASVGLQLYAPRRAATSVVYGALGGVIVLLLYLYVLGASLVVGAHVNAGWYDASPSRGPEASAGAAAIKDAAPWPKPPAPSR